MPEVGSYRHGSGYASLHRLQVVVLSAVIGAGSLLSIPVEALQRDVAASTEIPTIARASIPPPASPTTLFDDFNRTSSGPTWGPAPSGWTWGTYDNPATVCPGYSASVNGQNGVITGSAGATCILWGGDQTVSQGPLPRPWEGQSFALTGKFKTSAVDGSQLGIGVFTRVNQYWIAGASMYVSAGSGSITAEGGSGGSASYAWQANTWYSMKVAVIYGDQVRVRVWPSAQTEPTDWQAAVSAPLAFPEADHSPFGVIWGSSQGTTSVFVDDFAFGPAPFLPNLPPPPGTQDNPPYENQEAIAEPVSTFSGTLSETVGDLSVPGRGPAIDFARSYNSNDTRVTTLGPGWTHSYNTRLTSPGDATEDVILIGPQGRSDRYVKGAGGYTAPSGVTRTLVLNADGSYTAKDKSQTVWVFDASGLLLQVQDRFGNASNMTYDVIGRLIRVSDPAGRGNLTLAYNPSNGRLATITDWASPARVFRYFYDASGRLRQTADPDLKTTDYAYDGSTQRITTITNARTNVVMTNIYDPQGRVATQKDARGLLTGDETTFTYVENPDGTRMTTVTAPSTSLEPSFHPTLEDSYASNGWLTQRVTRPLSTATLTQQFTYDGDGDRTSFTDLRGNRTDYCYDVDYAGASVSGSVSNMTRTIGPPPTPGANRPVTLFKFDAKNNLIQSVAPKGVPSGTTADCSTNLSAIAPMHAVDSAYDGTGVFLISTTARFTDPDTGSKIAVTKYEYQDAANPGLVTRVIPPRGNTSPTPDYTYATVMSYYTSGSRFGLLKDQTDPLGNKTTYDYDPVGRLVTVVDPLGNAAGGIPAEHTLNFVYDNKDRLRFSKLPSPTAGGTQLISETRYDSVGNPVTEIDANGQVTTYTYDERNSLFQVKESPLAWTNPASPPATVFTTEYTRDAGGNPVRITRAKGDAANERAVDYAYDGRGLAHRETQYPSWPATTGPLTALSTYDANGNPLTVVDPLGRTTTFGYDPINRLTSTDYSDLLTPDTSFAYDANGNRTSMVDGTGTTGYVVDEANRLTAVNSPGSVTVGYRYDLDGNRTKLIYPDATSVIYAFDKASQLQSLVDWAARSVSYTYWGDGRVKTATNPDASVATYAYDNARRLIDVLHQRTSTTISHHAYQLDPVGNVTSTQEVVTTLTPPPTWSPQAAINDVLTNDQLRPVTTVGADGSVYAVWSDARSGNSDIYYSRRDPSTGLWSASELVNTALNGPQTQPAIAVDAAGSAYVIWTDQSIGTETDIYFRKRSAATGTWGAYSIVNDDGFGKAQNDPSIEMSPTGEAIAVWYDERGGGSKKNIYSARLPAGASTWAANSKVTSDTSAVKGEPEVTIGADGTSHAAWRDHRSGNGDIWFASLAAGGSTWTTNTKISDDPGTTLQGAPEIGTDTAGNVLSVWADARTTPSQIRVRRRPAGSMTWAASVVVGGSTVNAPAIQVRPDGRAYTAWSNGTLGTLTTVWGSEYDVVAGTWSAPERLTETTEESAAAAVVFTTTQLLVAYQRRLTSGNFDIYSRRKGLVGDTFAYGYDRLYRLLSVAGPDGPRSYSYDPVGNRLTRSSGTTTSYAYDRADRMLNAGSTAVTVDANGNLTVKGTASFSFDQANEMTGSVYGTTETYVYDGNGTRFSRQVGASPAIRYVSDVNLQLPATISDGTSKFVYGVGLAYAATGSSIEVYHSDRLGSTRALTNASGSVTAAYRTDEWGMSTANVGASAQPFGFTGEPRDATGLTYLRARYYDPDLGIFTSRDTWSGAPSHPQTQNRYAYAIGNPISNTDPSGHIVDTLLDIGFTLWDLGSLVFGPEKERSANGIALAADVGAIFVPFVTGAGLITRGASKIDDVGDGIHLLEDAAKVGCSFTAETLVATPDGSVPISEVHVGDIVLAWDEMTDQVVGRRVTSVLRHPDDTIARLTLDGIGLTTTPDHPFFTVEQGWIEAGLLWPGAHVKSSSGISVVGTIETTSSSAILWDLTIDSAHTFFVGSGAWLVHNCPADDLIEGGIPAIPGNPFPGPNAVNDAFDHLRDFHGLDPHVASENLHALKGLAGLPPDAKVIFGRTGDIYDAVSHEYLGNLITGH